MDSRSKDWGVPPYMMPWSLVQLPRPALAGLLLVLDQGRATEDDEEEAKAK